MRQRAEIAEGEEVLSFLKSQSEGSRFGQDIGNKGSGFSFQRDGEHHFIHHDGDRFLLCMDGVTDGLYNSYLEEILHAPTEEPARQLVKSAADSSGRDNTTALIIEVQCPR